ncbi:hypothetical protein AB0M43_34965 [Longispora sp. NPDC051575]|uniref:hypothetical protein n=1 Tax=Longispora sp. NPDC051575 TaxID=3154943 RepID=UPI00342ADDC7
MKIVKRTEYAARIVDSEPVTVTKLVWSDGGLSFEVTDAAGVDLTIDECFDSPPTDSQIRSLLQARRASHRLPMDQG